MGNYSAKRIAGYTALFAAGSVVACPAIGLAAGSAAAGAAVASIFGNTLASDLHAAFVANKLDPLANHHLRQLVGDALAVLIECYERENAAPNVLQRLLPAFKLMRLPDAELSALATSAREHWNEVDLTGGSERLQDAHIQQAFSDHDRADPTPYVSPDEWDRHLSVLAQHAQTRWGDQVWLRDAHRRALAEYIAPWFAIAVRELVKADLDPSVGTGGRVFIALHLELMRSMSSSIRSLDGKADQQLHQLEAVEENFASFRLEIIKKFDNGQKSQYLDLARTLRDDIHETRRVLDEKLDGILTDQQRHTVKLDIVGVGVQQANDGIVGLQRQVEKLASAVNPSVDRSFERAVEVMDEVTLRSIVITQFYEIVRLRGAKS